MNNQAEARTLSIIIPVYNEVDNVAPLFYEIEKALIAGELLYEVIFVDDGSNDGTAHRLRELAAHHDKLRVLVHKRNFGQSSALVTGAKAARYAMLLTMDGDGQNDPADILSLFDYLPDTQTVVLGTRAKRNDAFLRKVSSRIGNGVRRFFLKDSCPDTGCSLKLFSRQGFLDLPHFNHCHRFLPTLFQRAGFKLVNVAVNHRPRQHGVSKYGVMNRLFVGIHDLIGVRWLLKRYCAPEVMSHD